MSCFSSLPQLRLVALGMCCHIFVGCNVSSPLFSHLISLVSEIQAFPSSSFRRCRLYFAIEGEVEAICRFFLVSQVSWYFCSILSCRGILFNIRACLVRQQISVGSYRRPLRARADRATVTGKAVAAVCELCRVLIISSILLSKSVSDSRPAATKPAL